MHGFAARQRDGRRPERIVRRGHQDLVARIEQPLHGHRDELAHAVAGIDIVQTDIGDFFVLRVPADRLSSLDDPLGVRITLRLGEPRGDRVDHRHGRTESEGRRVADIQLHVHLHIY